MSKTATVAKGNSTGRQSERVNHKVFGTRSAVIKKKNQKNHHQAPPKFRNITTKQCNTAQFHSIRLCIRNRNNTSESQPGKVEYCSKLRTRNNSLGWNIFCNEGRFLQSLNFVVRPSKITTVPKALWYFVPSGANKGQGNIYSCWKNRWKPQ